MSRRGLFLSILAVPGLAMAQQSVHFRPHDNLVTVQATINGKTVNAFLDSGSGTMVVSKSLATELGLQLGHSPLQASGAGTGNQSIFPVKLKSVEFDSLALSDVSGYAIDLGSISSSSGLKVDALLGYPFFENHVVRVNYAESTVSIYPENDPPGCPNPIPFELMHNVPVVTAKVRSLATSAPETVHVVVDLGSRHYNYLGTAFLQSDAGKALYTHGHKQAVGEGTGGRAMGVVSEFAELSVGTQHFHNVKFALTEQVKAFNLEQVDGSLGVPLWAGGIITFNYPKQQICIQAPRKSS
jgi:hypothetical protein